ncbi:MAG: glycosyltransferase [Kiritimatiellae bacterium]|nr:glycosyltransferase [Kiritimatiellia bacterium]
MNILHVVPSYDISGRSRLIHELCLALQGPEFTFMIVCLTGQGTYVQKDVPLVYLAKREGFDVRAARRLAGLIREHEISLVHCHGGAALPYAALACGLSGRRPLLHTVHRSDGDPVASNPIKAKMVLAPVDLVVGVSEAASAAFCNANDFPTNRTMTIYNGIDPTRFSPGLGGTCDGYKPVGRPVIGTVANLSYDKDHGILIRAFAEILSSYPAARLVIVGDGPWASHARALVAELGVGAHVDFLGFRGDVPALLRTFDVFAYPTTTEGFGLALVEAMAAGVPVVASNVGGVPEVVTNGVTGLLVEFGDVEAFRAEIVRLLNDRALCRRLVAAAEKAVSSRFTVRRMADEYAAVYQRLAAGRGR